MMLQTAGRRRSELFKDAHLYVITDSRPRATPLATFLSRIIAAGTTLVQLREKNLSDAELLARACECAQVCRQRGALFIVNDRVDVALACGADGVHVGQDDLPASALRRLAGENFVIGLSTHSPQQVAEAQSLDIDYIAVGPIHATPTKPGRPAVGLDLVRYAATYSHLPFFAIGGLDASNVADAIAAGAQRVSVLRCVSQAADPDTEVKALLEKFPPVIRNLG